MIGLFINILLLVWFMLSLRSNKNSKDIFVIAGVYLISSLGALYFDPLSIPGFMEVRRYDVFVFILFGLLVIYGLSPLWHIRNVDQRPDLNRIEISSFLKKILLVAGIGAVYSIVYQLPYAIESLTKGGHVVRTEILTDEDQTVLPRTMFTTIAVFFSTFFPLYTAFFFISLKNRLPPLYIFLMFCGSISYLVSSLCFAARDGVVFYVLFNLIFLLFFWRSFDFQVNRKLKITFGIIAVVNLLIIATFTVSRFGDAGGGLSEGTVGYISQQPFVFAQNIFNRENTQYFNGLSLRFQLITDVLGTTNVKERTQPYEWSFGTYLTDFYAVDGFFSLFALTAAFVEFFRFHLKRARRIPVISYLIIYTLFSHFLISGVFYFRLGTFSGNFYIVAMIIFFFMAKRRKRRIRI